MTWFHSLALRLAREQAAKELEKVGILEAVIARLGTGRQPTEDKADE